MTNLIGNWFECKVKYVKIDENGNEKKVTEPYLVDAVSFTEAETRIHTELEKMIHGDFMVWNISRSNISELFPNENGDRWFKAKTKFVTVDEESGKEKKSINYMLVEANNVTDAYELLEEGLKDMIVPFEIPSVTESPILDVFPFFKDEVNEDIPENLKPLKEVIGLSKCKNQDSTPNCRLPDEVPECYGTCEYYIPTGPKPFVRPPGNIGLL